jgi:DNA-binding MarR family transcriptional regulator
MSQPWVPETPYEHAVMDALKAVRAFGDALDRMHGGMKGEMDMNANDLAALRMLIIREQRGESVSPHDVARHLRISTASTTKLLDRLAASGHVERRPHPSDRRARVVVLTDESRRAFHRHFGRRLQAMRGVAEGYTHDELLAVTQFLGDIGSAMDVD